METKITGDKLTATWAKADVDAVAKKEGKKLDNEERKLVLKRLGEYMNANSTAMIISCLPDKTASTAPPTSVSDDPVCKWYYHSSSSRNETKEAIAAALDGNHPILVMACKPACDVCALVWKNLKATTDFADYLKKKGIVAIKVEDSSSHFTDLAKAKNKYVGIDGISGKKINSTAPFFIFFKPSEKARSDKKITLVESQVETFLSGYGDAKSSAKTYDTVTAWLDAVFMC